MCLGARGEVASTLVVIFQRNGPFSPVESDPAQDIHSLNIYIESERTPYHIEVEGYCTLSSAVLDAHLDTHPAGVHPTHRHAFNIYCYASARIRNTGCGVVLLRASLSTDIYIYILTRIATCLALVLVRVLVDLGALARKTTLWFGKRGRQASNCALGEPSFTAAGGKGKKRAT